MRYGVDFNPFGITIPADLDLIESRNSQGLTRTAEEALGEMFRLVSNARISSQRGILLDIKEEAHRTATRWRDNEFIEQETLLVKCNARRRHQGLPPVSWKTHR